MCCGNIALVHDEENATFFFLIVKNKNVPYQEKKMLSACTRGHVILSLYSEDMSELN